MAKQKMPVATTKNPVPVKIVSEASEPKESKDYEAREKRYRAEDDIRTMQRVLEIQKDKERMKAMKQVAKEQINTLKKCL